MADVNNNNNGGGKTKYRRQPRMNPLLPDRPKKPMHAFNLCVQDYFRDHPENSNVQDTMTDASEYWNTQTPEQKKIYEDRCHPDKVRFDQELIKWKQQKKILKRPASSFAMFLKNTWEEQGDSGRNISAMCKYARDQWVLMSEDDKNVYRLNYANLTEAYKETIDKLNNGEMNIDAIGEQVPMNNDDA